LAIAENIINTVSLKVGKKRGKMTVKGLLKKQPYFMPGSWYLLTMAELADATDLSFVGSDTMWVRPPLALLHVIVKGTALHNDLFF